MICQDKELIRPDGKTLSIMFTNIVIKNMNIIRNDFGKYFINDVPYITEQFYVSLFYHIPKKNETS